MTSSVIAFTTAIVYAREGVDVTIVFLPDDKDDAQKTKNAVEKEGRSCLLVRGNIMSCEACADAVRQHVSKFGHVHILVNNSSKHTPCDGPLNIDLSMVYGVFHGEVLPIFAMTKYALPHMNEGSSIINTTSDYFFSKSTIVLFSSFLANSLREKGIRVNAVASCPVRALIQPAPRPKEYMEDPESLPRFGRVHQLCKIVPTFVFLASKDAQLYTDQIMYPSGDCREHGQR